MNENGAQGPQALIGSTNLDGQFTLSDVSLWLYEAYFLPGDFTLYMLFTHAPELARFLDLDPTNYQGPVSGLLSAVIWLGSFVLMGGTYNFVRSLDRAVTARIVNLYLETRRAFRVAKTRLGLVTYRRWFRTQQIRPEESIEVGICIPKLDELEIAVLRSHQKLTPGYALTASDVASDLGIGTSQARHTLHRLAQLQLLDSTFSTSEGEGGYRLSQPGAFILSGHRGSG